MGFGSPCEDVMTETFLTFCLPQRRWTTKYQMKIIFFTRHSNTEMCCPATLCRVCPGWKKNHCTKVSQIYVVSFPATQHFCDKIASDFWSLRGGPLSTKLWVTNIFFCRFTYSDLFWPYFDFILSKFSLFSTPDYSSNTKGWVKSFEPPLIFTPLFAFIRRNKVSFWTFFANDAQYA